MNNNKKNQGEVINMGAMKQLMQEYIDKEEEEEHEQQMAKFNQLHAYDR